jgi:hypothetical protein
MRLPITERRSPNRSKNVTRLPSARSTANTTTPEPVATRKTGSDDEWASF